MAPHPSNQHGGAIDENGALREIWNLTQEGCGRCVRGLVAIAPALLLDGRPSAEGRVAVALAGKVFCKVDATSSPVEFGGPSDDGGAAGPCDESDRSRQSLWGCYW